MRPRTAAKLRAKGDAGGTTGRLRRAVAFALAVALALPLPAATLLVGPASAAEAAGYDDGFAKYQKGDFKGAERALKEALGAKLARPEAAKVLKLLGICQFMQNNKSGATRSFKGALARDPATLIAAEEVLDDSVIGFFNAIKGKPAPKTKAKAPAQTAKAEAPAPPLGAPAAPPAGPKAGGDAKGKPLKQTFLKVVANIPTANVAIDGIIAGPVNSLINTDPGKVLVEVSASGYPTKKVYVNITKDRENSVNVTLEKPKPKPKAVPKPKPKPKAPPPAPAQDDEGDGGVAPALAGNDAEAGAPAGAQDPGSGAVKAAAGKPRAPKAAAGGKGKRRKNGQQGGDELFAGDDAAQRRRPNRQGGNGGQGGGPQGPDLASQFDMDSGAGGYAQPAPGYGAPQGYPPQGYAPPPQYYAPPPQYYAPPQPQYYAPPPPPPPPADPAGGFPDQPSDPGAAGAPRSQGDPATADAGGGDGGGKSGNSTLIAILPLGAGQFQNHAYLLGAAFLVGELGALYYYQSTNASADKAIADTNAYLAANCAPAATTDASGQPTPVGLACTQFSASRQAFVTSTRASAMYGIYGFVGLWIVGAAEAIIDEPTAADLAPKRKKKKKKRKYSGFSYNAETRDYQLVELPEERWVEFMAFDWQAGVVPTYAPQERSLVPAVSLELKWTF